MVPRHPCRQFNDREMEETRAIPVIHATTLLLTATPMREIKTPRN